eukprot:12926861-Alexandrium_andersonii.AAC.1
MAARVDEPKLDVLTTLYEADCYDLIQKINTIKEYEKRRDVEWDQRYGVGSSPVQRHRGAEVGQKYVKTVQRS